MPKLDFAIAEYYLSDVKTPSSMIPSEIDFSSFITFTNYMWIILWGRIKMIQFVFCKENHFW